MITLRFAQASDMSTFTTGRSDIWVNYFEYFRLNPLTVFFGKGYTNILINEKASHNTLIQIIFQFGIVGSVCLFMWIKQIIKISLSGIKIGKKSVPLFIILLIGTVFPWMGIDIMFFDEFYLMIFYLCLGGYCMQDKHLSAKKDHII